MIVKVIESFIDIHTKAVHPLGEKFECTVDRYREIERYGHYVDVVTEKKEVKASK